MHYLVQLLNSAKLLLLDYSINQWVEYSILKIFDSCSPTPWRSLDMFLDTGTACGIICYREHRQFNIPTDQHFSLKHSKNEQTSAECEERTV